MNRGRIEKKIEKVKCFTTEIELDAVISRPESRFVIDKHKIRRARLDINYLGLHCYVYFENDNIVLEDIDRLTIKTMKDVSNILDATGLPSVIFAQMNELFKEFDAMTGEIVSKTMKDLRKAESPYEISGYQTVSKCVDMIHEHLNSDSVPVDFVDIYSEQFNLNPKIVEAVIATTTEMTK